MIRPEPRYRLWDTWEPRVDDSTPQSAGGRAKAGKGTRLILERQVGIAAYWLTVDPSLRVDRKVANG